MLHLASQSPRRRQLLEQIGVPFAMLDVDVIEARTSKSRPNLGIVKFKCTVRNARGEALGEMTSPILIERRAGAV